MELKVAIDGGGDDAVTNVKVNGTKSCISECNPFGFCLTLREDWVTWEKAYGRNRSFRKKYLDLIAAAKTTAAKDPSISPFAPKKIYMGASSSSS